MSEVSLTCRSCGRGGLSPVLSLGRMPLANAFITSEQLPEQEPIYPLDLVFCPGCTLVQITETVPPETLFRDYLYFSSYSDTMLGHAHDLACWLISSRALSEKSLVVEVGSNDGYLLQYFVQDAIPVLGIEPAENVAAVASLRGIRTISEFFGKALAYRLRAQGQVADVVIANNVLAHVADLNSFVEGVQQLLKEDGIAVIEVPYVKEMIDRREFDTIYHEHLCYFSVTALDRLFRRHQLMLVEVQRIPVHGGSLRVHAAHMGRARADEVVAQLLDEEARWGVNQVGTYGEFGRQAQGIRASLREFLRSLKDEGRHIAAYGAAAKGTVLLNYCGIGSDLVDFVVDRSPYKQGRYVPGVRLPILPPSRLVEVRPDYTLLLAWNIADEILQQQVEYRRMGGRFIIPIPELKVV